MSAGDANATERAVANADEVARAAQRLRGKRERLAALGPERIASAIANAARRLSRETNPTLRAEAQRSTGLSPEMIEWCLSTTLATLSADACLSLLAEQRPAGARTHALCSVVLAGNVFTAALRALCLPLLSGAPVLAKAASHDDTLARHFLAALRASDADVGAACELVRFSRDDLAALDALLADAQLVSIYGDDSTVAQIRARTPPHATVLEHGHGFSAAYISRAALRSEAAARAAAERLAIDVAAYDQRGCLSPVVAYVEPGGALDALAFSKLLGHQALPELDRLLPRGHLSESEKAASLQWRAVASTRGELFATPSSAASYEASLSLRPTPGVRHLAVHDIANLDDLIARLTSFAPHLKSLGIAGSRELRTHLAQRLSVSVTRLGEMQTPPLAALADGLPALAGYFA